ARRRGAGKAGRVARHARHQKPRPARRRPDPHRQRGADRRAAAGGAHAGTRPAVDVGPDPAMSAARASRLAPAALAGALVIGASLLAAGLAPARAFPVHGDQTVLPVGSELNEDAIDRPRELFHSEATGGSKSYLVKLGDTAFSAPTLLGGVARRAGISCATCHVNGANNPKLYPPGLSTRA